VAPFRHTPAAVQSAPVKENGRLNGLENVELLGTSYLDFDVAIIKLHLLRTKCKPIATI